MRSRREKEHSLNFHVAHLWPLVILVGICAFLNTHPIRPHDFWWHIAAGREIATTRRIPLVDRASSTAAGTPYHAYQVYWLAETALYLVHRLGGPALTVFIHSVTITSAYALTLWLCYQQTRRWRVAALATLFAATLGVSDWNVRPQAATFWIVPFLLLSIRAYRQRSHRYLLAAFPLGLALWVNCHGSFPIGLLLIGLWLVDVLWAGLGESSRTEKARISAPLMALLLAITGCLINPRGFGVIDYLGEMATDPVVQGMVPEWAPPTFDSVHGGLFLGGLLSVATLLAVSPKRPSAFQLLSFLAFAALGLRTSRGIIWFGLVMAPVVAEHSAKLGQRIGGSVRGGGKEHPALNATVATLLLLSTVITLPWFKRHLPLPATKAGLVSNETPVSATEFLLMESPPGPIFNDMAFGSYLVWAAQPAYPVFVDPRIELYPSEIWLDYLRISAAQCDWEERLASYRIQTLMLSPTTQATLVQAAQRSAEWQEIYSDASAVILQRQSTD